MGKAHKITKADLKRHFSEEKLWEIAEAVLEGIDSLKKDRFDMPVGAYDEYACRRIVRSLKKELFTP